MNEFEKNKVEHALEYAELGYRVIPLDGKIPKFDKPAERASSDPEQIKSWWADGNSNLNIGVITDGFCVLDVDVKDGAKHGPDNLNKGGYEIPNTLLVKTPTKGQHWWFKDPENTVNRGQNKPVQDVDIISSGSFIMGVGSTIDAIEYIGDKKPVEELLERPAWLYEATQKPKYVAPKTLPVPGNKIGIDEVKTALKFIEPNGMAYGDFVQVGMAIHNEFPSEEDGLPLWDEWAKADEDGYKVGECESKWPTFTQGGGMGIGTLIQMAKAGGYARPIKQQAQHVFDPVVKSPNSVLIDDVTIFYSLKDYTGDAIRNMDGDWFYWDGERWLAGSDAVKIISENYDQNIDSMLADASVRFQSNAADARTALQTLSKAKNNRRRTDVYSIIKEKCGIEPTLWDSDSNLLATRNGVLLLDNSGFRLQQKDDYIKRTLNADYDQNATCPEWLRFLDEAMGSDKLMVDYLQKLCGYFLTTSVQEQIIIFLYGIGGTGKSTFLDTISGTMGDYVTHISADTLLKNKLGTKTSAAMSDMANAAGARLTRTDELPAVCKLDTALVKSYTGDSKVTAKKLYHDSFTYTATSKLVMYGNDKPFADFTDGGLWRRMRLIQFKHIPKEVDKMLGHKLVQERSGILNWMIQGLELWQSEGLETPQSVIDDSASYREELNTVDKFLDDSVTYQAGFTATATLKGAYEAWCSRNAYVPTDPDLLTKQIHTYFLSKPGVEPKRKRVDGNQTRGYSGINCNPSITEF